MNLKIQFLTLVLLVLVLFACSPNAESFSEDDITIIHERTIKSGEILEFDFQSILTEGGRTIKEQAKNFEISEIDLTIYRYKPLTDFIGKDAVIIEQRGSTGGDDFFSTFVKIEITVLE